VALGRGESNHNAIIHLIFFHLAQQFRICLVHVNNFCSKRSFQPILPFLTLPLGAAPPSPPPSYPTASKFLASEIFRRKAKDESHTDNDNWLADEEECRDIAPHIQSWCVYQLPAVSRAKVTIDLEAYVVISVSQTPLIQNRWYLRIVFWPGICWLATELNISHTRNKTLFAKPIFCQYTDVSQSWKLKLSLYARKAYDGEGGWWASRSSRFTPE
jgi:hypothetical protein